MENGEKEWKLVRYHHDDNAIWLVLLGVPIAWISIAYFAESIFFYLNPLFVIYFPFLILFILGKKFRSDDGSASGGIWLIGLIYFLISHVYFFRELDDYPFRHYFGLADQLSEWGQQRADFLYDLELKYRSFIN